MAKQIKQLTEFGTSLFVNIETRLQNLSLTRRACESSGLSLTTNFMAWRPYENLIDGELDNRVPGKVTGWMRFLRSGKRPLKVSFNLEGDFHEDIRGKVIRLQNPQSADRAESLGRKESYMDGFSAKQHGQVGDITAGLPLGVWDEARIRNLIAQYEEIWNKREIPKAEQDRLRHDLADQYKRSIDAGEPFYPYVDYPYIEWFSDSNGRVVLELEPNQVEIIEERNPPRQKTPRELAEAEMKRVQAFGNFLSEMADQLSGQDRKQGGDGNVHVAVIQ